jgi:uncharacterized protein YkwD
MVQAVGLLSDPGEPTANASAACMKAHGQLTVLSSEYAVRSKGPGSVLDWLATIKEIAGGWRAGEQQADARGLLDQFLKDVDATRANWAVAEDETFALIEKLMRIEVVRAQEKAGDREYLTKRWAELRDEPQSTLDKPAIKRQLSKEKVVDVRAHFHRLRSAIAELLGELAAKKSKLGDLKTVREELLAATNTYRVTGGKRKVGTRGPLVLEKRLNRAAQSHAVYLAQPGSTFGHVGEQGSSVEQRIVVYEGYLTKTTAENIARGQQTPVAAVESWIESPGHERNLVDADVRAAGFGYATDDNGVGYWVQTFGEAPR